MRIVRSDRSVIMPGVCLQTADPMLPSLRFRPEGCAYECWTGLVYHLGSVHDKTQTGFGTLSSGDVMTFCLNTDLGELSMYRNDRLMGVIERGLEGQTLHAYVGLEQPGDAVAIYHHTKAL